MKFLIVAFLCLTFSTTVLAQSNFIDVETGNSNYKLIQSANSILLPQSEQFSNTIIFKGKVSQIAVGEDMKCAMDDEAVKCWLNNRSSKNYFIPSNLKSPSSIVAKFYRACATDDGEVKCWNSRNQRINIPLTFKNPKTIALGQVDTCVLDDEGVKCWGDNYTSKNFTVPTNLKNPRSLTSGDTHSCVLDDEGVKCWGERTDNSLSFLKNPTAVYAGPHSTCALDSEGIKCWGYIFYGREYKSWLWENLNDKYQYKQHGGQYKNIKNVILNDKDLCLWNDSENPSTLNEVHCFDVGLGSEYRGEPDYFKSVKSIAGSSSTICTLHDIGITCWEYNFSYSHSKKLIPHNLNGVEAIYASLDENICAKLKSEIKCWKNGYRSSVEWNDSYTVPVSENAKIISVTKDQICYINNDSVICDSPDNNISRREPILTIKNPLDGSDYCVRGEEEYVCWEFNRYGKVITQRFSLDNSKYFYSEKAQPLYFANQILANVNDTFENVTSLYYLREKIVELFLTGLQSEAAPTILNNTIFIRNHYVQNKGFKPQILSSRRSVQLRFILDIMANSLSSSKYLLSDNSKLAVDKLKIEFANILSEDDISIEEAGNLVTMTLNETNLMKEMTVSYRLVGIKQFYDWAYNYIATGNY
jgi:hypothetical protein